MIYKEQQHEEPKMDNSVQKWNEQWGRKEGSGH